CRCARNERKRSHRGGLGSCGSAQRTVHESRGIISKVSIEHAGGTVPKGQSRLRICFVRTCCGCPFGTGTNRAAVFTFSPFCAKGNRGEDGRKPGKKGAGTMRVSVPVCWENLCAMKHEFFHLYNIRSVWRVLFIAIKKQINIYVLRCCNYS